eukprot:1425424-Lingulodinium_polyedra.AAC.1
MRIALPLAAVLAVPPRVPRPGTGRAKAAWLETEGTRAQSPAAAARITNFSHKPPVTCVNKSY